MAVDIFLKLDGIKGESRDGKHKEEIDVLSWSWGAEQSGKAGNQSGAGSGKVNVHDLTITKYVDKSTPNLFLYTCNGKHISTGLLTMRKAGENPVEYLKIDMKEIILTNYQTGGTSSEDRQIETFSLNFASVKKTYTQQNADGTAGTSIDQGWDIAANQKL